MGQDLKISNSNYTENFTIVNNEILFFAKIEQKREISEFWKILAIEF